MRQTTGSAHAELERWRTSVEADACSHIRIVWRSSQDTYERAATSKGSGMWSGDEKERDDNTDGQSQTLTLSAMNLAMGQTTGSARAELERRRTVLESRSLQLQAY
eukprot:scpid95444/ scgid31538/ 